VRENRERSEQETGAACSGGPVSPDNGAGSQDGRLAEVTNDTKHEGPAASGVSKRTRKKFESVRGGNASSASGSRRAPRQKRTVEFVS
jgi:hypothetical protein